MQVTEIVECKGTPFGKLTAYPLTMRNYETFTDNKVCLTLMQKKFGIEMTRIPYLRMITYLSTKEINLLAMLSKILSLVFRINEEQIRLSIDNEMKVTLFVVEEADPLQVIETISELRFAKLRRLIAEQNNIKLPNEKANLEILESEEEIAKQNGADLNVDFKSLFFSVATYCGFDTETMLNMTIFEFEERISAISRIMKHSMYGQGELSGMVTFKNGNPYPSWCFDRAEDGLHGTIPLASFQQQMSKAVTMTN